MTSNDPFHEQVHSEGSTTVLPLNFNLPLNSPTSPLQTRLPHTFSNGGLGWNVQSILLQTLHILDLVNDGDEDVQALEEGRGGVGVAGGCY